MATPHLMANQRAKGGPLAEHFSRQQRDGRVQQAAVAGAARQVSQVSAQPAARRC